MLHCSRTMRESHRGSSFTTTTSGQKALSSTKRSPISLSLPYKRPLLLSLRSSDGISRVTSRDDSFNFFLLGGQTTEPINCHCRLRISGLTTHVCRHRRLRTPLLPPQVLSTVVSRCSGEAEAIRSSSSGDETCPLGGSTDERLSSCSTDCRVVSATGLSTTATRSTGACVSEQI